MRSAASRTQAQLVHFASPHSNLELLTAQRRQSSSSIHSRPAVNHESGLFSCATCAAGATDCPKASYRSKLRRPFVIQPQSPPGRRLVLHTMA